MYLTQLKKIYPFLKEMDSIAGQKACEALINGFKNVYKVGVGYVKWKSCKNPVQTFKTTFEIIDGRLKIPKLKETIKMKIWQTSE
jgi:putative transposase